MKKTKTQIKSLITNSSHLTNEDKKEWLNLVKIADEKTLKEIFGHFSKTFKDENEFKLKLLYKANLDENFIEKTKETTKKFKKRARNKAEKYLRETTEKPEDALKKLDNIYHAFRTSKKNIRKENQKNS